MSARTEPVPSPGSSHRETRIGLFPRNNSILARNASARGALPWRAARSAARPSASAACSKRLNMALRTICQDAMGKEAVRQGLKLVKLKNVKDEAARKLAFGGGVLEMDCAYAKGISGGYSDNEIRPVLENG